MKKRSITLVEVLIALGLLSLLLSSLFFWYRNLSSCHSKLNHIKSPLQEERYVLQRLQKILPKAELPFFQSDQGSLVFVFDRGVAPNPALSGKVLARLYYDQSIQGLCLGLWPEPPKEGSFSETLLLLDHIKKAKISYYHPPDPFKKPVSPEEVGKLRPKEGWQKEWKIEYDSLPSFVKVKLKRDPLPGLEKEGDRTIELCFDLMQPIVYPKGI